MVSLSEASQSGAAVSIASLFKLELLSVLASTKADFEQFLSKVTSDLIEEDNSPQLEQKILALRTRFKQNQVSLFFFFFFLSILYTILFFRKPLKY
jgi:hypothetical protein